VLTVVNGICVAAGNMTRHYKLTNYDTGNFFHHQPVKALHSKSTAVCRILIRPSIKGLQRLPEQVNTVDSVLTIYECPHCRFRPHTSQHRLTVDSALTTLAQLTETPPSQISTHNISVVTHPILRSVAVAQWHGIRLQSSPHVGG
jgi:hypothetical protein